MFKVGYDPTRKVINVRIPDEVGVQLTAPPLVHAQMPQRHRLVGILFTLSHVV
jgi:hypothetical protein